MFQNTFKSYFSSKLSRLIFLEQKKKKNSNHNRSENTAALIADNNAESDIDRFDGNISGESVSRLWKKCAKLKESASDITTQEEYFKFDFQVRIPFEFNLTNVLFFGFRCFFCGAIF